MLKLQTFLAILHQLHSNEIHGDNWKVWSKVLLATDSFLVRLEPMMVNERKIN
jgi:hypothetical protein